MSDMLQTGTAWLSSQLAEHASREAVYRRGADSVELRVTTGQSEFPRESADGITTEKRTLDFLFAASALILDGQPTEPEPGDTIAIAGFGTFELCAPGGSEPAWRYSDPHRVMIRAHAQEVAT